MFKLTELKQPDCTHSCARRSIPSEHLIDNAVMQLLNMSILHSQPPSRWCYSLAVSHSKSFPHAQTIGLPAHTNLYTRAQLREYICSKVRVSECLPLGSCEGKKNIAPGSYVQESGSGSETSTGFLIISVCYNMNASVFFCARCLLPPTTLCVDNGNIHHPRICPSWLNSMAE